jgi:tetratricopeptide (TPR) repeat protein
MKKILFTLAGTLCLGLPLSAQTGEAAANTNQGINLSMPVQTTPMVAVTDFFRNPEWMRSFAYSFTPLSEVEPSPDPATQEFFKGLAQVLGAQNPDLNLARKMLQDELGNGNEKGAATLYFTLGAIEQQIAASTQSNKSASEAMLQSAINNYNKAVELFPNFQRAHRNLGMIFMNRGEKADVGSAIPHLEKALALGANDASTYAMIGYCNFLLGNYYSAESALKTSLFYDTKNKDVYQLLAQVLLIQTRYKEARAMFSELLKDDPNNAQWWMAMVNTYLAENDLENSVVALEVLRHMKKAEAQSLYLLGNIYLTRNMFDMAADVYCQAVAENPAKELDAAISAVNSLAGYSAFEQATRVLNAINRQYKGPKSAEQSTTLLTLQSNISIAQGHGEEAEQTLRKILELDPQNGGALNTLASYYSETIMVDEGNTTVARPRDAEQAIMLLERAEDLTDDQAKLAAYRQHARLLVGKGDTESFREAVKLLERAQAIAPQESVETYIQELRKAIMSRSN